MNFQTSIWWSTQITRTKNCKFWACLIISWCASPSTCVVHSRLSILTTIKSSRFPVVASMICLLFALYTFTRTQSHLYLWQSIYAGPASKSFHSTGSPTWYRMWEKSSKVMSLNQASIAPWATRWITGVIRPRLHRGWKPSTTSKPSQMAVEASSLESVNRKNRPKKTETYMFWKSSAWCSTNSATKMKRSEEASSISTSFWCTSWNRAKFSRLKIWFRRSSTRLKSEVFCFSLPRTISYTWSKI